jgi:hypothetical protein
MFHWTCVCVKWKRSWKNWSRVENKTRDSSSSAFSQTPSTFFFWQSHTAAVCCHERWLRQKKGYRFPFRSHSSLRLNWLSCQKHLSGWFFIENDDEEGRDRDEWNSIENGKSMKRNWEFVKWWIKKNHHLAKKFSRRGRRTEGFLKRFRYNFISFSLHLTTLNMKSNFTNAGEYISIYYTAETNEMKTFHF